MAVAAITATVKTTVLLLVMISAFKDPLVATLLLKGGKQNPTMMVKRAAIVAKMSTVIPLICSPLPPAPSRRTLLNIIILDYHWMGLVGNFTR